MPGRAALMAAACVAAHEAEQWAASNPGLARLRRRDALALIRFAQSTTV